MAIQLPDLPYAKDALAPVISANTLEFHYGKHHRAYVDNANKLIAGTDLEKESLEAIIKKTAGDASKVGIFNNTAQVWNHSFYWQCLKPGEMATSEDLKDFLKDKVKADWWIPDQFVFLDQIPKTSVGKFSKKDLREMVASGKIVIPGG